MLWIICLSAFGDERLDRKFSPEYFGVHAFYTRASVIWPNGVDTVIPGSVGAWRLWDTPGTTWKELQRSAGSWDFDRLDDYTRASKKANQSLLLVLGQTPHWAAADPHLKSGHGDGAASMPANVATWRAYVRKVARRYQGQISAYEIWNEPRLIEVDAPPTSGSSAGYFFGTARELVELTAVARTEISTADSAALLVSPGFSGGAQGLRRLAAYLDAGACQYIDAVGFHFYQVDSSAPEDLPLLVNAVRHVLEKKGCGGKPIWNTESGLMIQSNSGIEVRPQFPGEKGVLGNVLSADVAAGRIIRYLVLGRFAGIERYYWFALDSASMGLMTIDSSGRYRVLNNAGRAYLRGIDWLKNKKLTSCDLNQLVAKCRLTDSSSNYLLLWSGDEKSREIAVPREWAGGIAFSILGSNIRLGNNVMVNGLPILIKLP